MPFTTFSSVWDTASAKDMGDVPCDTSIALTSSTASSVVGGRTQARLISDGIHIPTFDGAPHPNWVNQANAYNVVSLVRVGGSTHWTVAVSIGRLTTLAITPTFPIAPAIVGLPYVGIPLTAINPPTGAPIPTLTYQWYSNGTAIGGATSATYQPVSGDIGHTITVKITGTSSSGTVNQTSAATAAIQAHPADYFSFGTATVNGSSADTTYWSSQSEDGYLAYSCASAPPGGWQFGLYNPSNYLQATPGSDIYFDTSSAGRTTDTSPFYYAMDVTTAASTIPSVGDAYAVYGNGPSGFAFGGGWNIVNNFGSDGYLYRRFRRTMNSTYNPGVDTLQFEVSNDNGATFTIMGWRTLSGVGTLYPAIICAQPVLLADQILVKCSGA